MHIILANTWYPPHSGYGGVAMYNYYLSQALIRLGHKVTIIACRWSEAAPSYEELASGVRVHRLLINHRYRLHSLPILGRYMRSILQFYYSARVARVITSIQQKTHVDVVEFAEVGAEGFNYLNLPWRRPVVVRCHTPTKILRQHHLPEEIPYSTCLTEYMEGYSIRNADRITTPSNDMAQVIAKTYKVPLEEIDPIPNPLDVAEFAPVNLQRSSRPMDEVTILHVGRLERVKGIEILAKAIPMVLRDCPQARFVFIGASRSDEQTLKWQRLLETAGKDRVTFLGFQSQRELVRWYHLADLVVVPSINYESFSYTCAQAMTAGLPVIASRIGGIPETLDGGKAGLLFCPNDAEELANAILRLGSDTSLRFEIASKGFIRATQKFDAVIVAEQILETYLSIRPRKK